MNSIALPKQYYFIAGEKESEGTIVVEPCYPGYGITIGNAVRRVLLSSLPGAAVVGVKIEGAEHEFTSLPHIREDMLEIILNLKKLRLRIHESEPVKLDLEAHGQKKVTAADIKKNSAITVVNPELTIANITDMAGKIKMEIFTSPGKGYETIENRDQREKEIGYIEIDSFFSPVTAVGIKIENVRVGKMTNWDKLSLDIKTDGTISPENAFSEATKILIEQFNALLNKEDTAVDGETKDKIEENEETGSDEIEVVNDQVNESNEEISAGEESKAKKKRGRPKKIV
jgi:DNA-directed RNA polymerase subunit alpha